MKPTLKIVVIAAGLAVAAWPILRAADEPAPAPPPPPPAAGGDKSPDARPHHGQRDPMEQLERLKQALGLTPEQSDQILAIIKGNAPQRQAIFSDDSLSREEKGAKLHELMQGTQTQIRALLTPDQQKKFDAMPRFGRRGRNGGPGPGNPPPGDAPPPPGDMPPPASAPPATANPSTGGNT